MTAPYRITGLRHVMDAATSTPWAILPEKLDAISEVLSLRAGDALSADEISARIAAAKQSGPTARVSGSVAVIPLFGTIMPRANLMTEMIGGTSVAQWVEQVRAAVNNPDISAVVIDVDSPGGAV